MLFNTQYNISTDYYRACIVRDTVCGVVFTRRCEPIPITEWPLFQVSSYVERMITNNHKILNVQFLTTIPKCFLYFNTTIPVLLVINNLYDLYAN